MAFVKYSKMNYIDQLQGNSSQPEVNNLTLLHANEFDSWHDTKANDDDDFIATVNTSDGANYAECKEDGTQKENIPYWIYQHPRRIIALVVVGVLLFTTLSCVITGAIIHRMILTNLGAKQTVVDQIVNSALIEGADSIRYNRLNITMDGLHTMQINHSDAIDHLANLNHQLNETVLHLYKMLETDSDTPVGMSDTPIDINRRLENTVQIVYTMLEQLKTSVPVSDICKTCPDGWTQFGNTCYQLRGGDIVFTNDTTITLRACPGGWTQCRGSCYKKGRSRVTFNAAVEYCKRYNASAVEINTQAENEFIEDLMASSETCWMGLTDLESEGVWRWHSSGKKAEFFNWIPGQPDNDYAGQSEDCSTVMGSYQHHRYKWNDLPCNKRATAMCEIWSVN